MEAIQALSSRKVNESGKKEWYDKMVTLAETIEDVLIKLLLKLVKIEKEDKTSDERYKGMYRDALQFKMTAKKSKNANSNRQTHFKVYDLLTTLKKQNLLK